VAPVTAVPDPGWRQYKSDRDRLLRRYPELSLHMFATKDGVRVFAQLYRAAEPHLPRSVETIADATWQPKEVTPDKLVDWSIRALQAWLSRRMEGLGEVPPTS
jgi:hypothetical protein